MINLRALTILMVALVIMGGCSKQGKELGKNKQTTLRWSGYGYQMYDTFRSEESKKFEAIHPEVKVKYEPITQQFDSKILLQIAANIAPDVFFVGDLNTYISKGTLVDLTKWYREDKDFFKDIYPVLMEANMRNGKLYALPGNCSVSILYYNKNLFDKKGLSYPNESWTWKDFLEASKKLTIRDKKGKIIQYGCVVGLDLWPQLVLGNGGKVWNKDKTKCIINNPEAREALIFQKDLYTKYMVSPTPLQVREEGAGEPFIMGRAGMYWGSSWEVATFKIKKKKELNWDAAIIPKAERKERFISLDYNSIGVWTGSKHQKLAYELAKFMISPERIKFLVEVGDSLPISSKGEAMNYYLSDLDRPEKAREAMIKALSLSKNTRNILVNPHIPYTEQGKIIQDLLDRFFITGELSAEECLGAIEDKLNSILEGSQRLR